MEAQPDFQITYTATQPEVTATQVVDGLNKLLSQVFGNGPLKFTSTEAFADAWEHGNEQAIVWRVTIEREPDLAPIVPTRVGDLDTKSG